MGIETILFIVAIIIVAVAVLTIASSIILAHAQQQSLSDILAERVHVPKNCNYNRGELPDRHCTPGDTNPGIEQSNIQQTICKPGYSESVRPSGGFTTIIKQKLMQAYNVPSNVTGKYILDHLVPISSGGNPSSVKNMWPQPIDSAHKKDGLELHVHNLLCTGKVSLRDAENSFKRDWIKTWNFTGKPQVPANITID